MDEFIAVKTEPLDIDEPNEESLCAPEEEPSEPEATSLQSEPFCSLCLRDRPPNTIFHEFDIDNSGTLRDTVKDILAFELPAKKVLICTPCWKLLKLVENFRACCLKAFSWAEQHIQLERVVLPKPMEVEEDRWFSDENLKAIDGVMEEVERRVKWMEQSGTEVKIEIEEPCVGNGTDERVWECGKCHRKFYGSKSFAAHTQHCKGDSYESQLLKGQICPASYRNQHKKNKTYECRVTCGERFYGKQQLNRHEKLCRKNLGLEKPVEDSYQGIDPELESKPIEIQECEKCHRSFDGELSFKQHRNQCRTEGEPRKMQTCKICSNTFATTQMLKAHLNKHKRIKPYQCRKYCDRTFYGTSSRHAHEMACLKLEQGVQGGECESCHRFLEKRGLKAHMKSCQKKNKEGGRRLHQCDICPISFTRPSHLKAHRNKHIGIKPFKCGLNCGRTFIGLINLKKHHKFCPKRPAVVPTNSENVEKVIPIPDHKSPEEDGEDFARKVACRNLDLAVQAVECKSCHRFLEKRGLKTHMKNCQKDKEEGRRLYQCDICPIAFTQPDRLKAHHNKHLGIKPFECGFNCGTRFVSKANLNKHHKFCSKRPAAVPTHFENSELKSSEED